jgi:hypothetical protein
MLFLLILVHQEELDDFISDSETQDLCTRFNISNQDVDQISYVRVSYFPHQQGPYFGLVRYECTRNIEPLLDTEFPSFLHFCLQEWHKYCEREQLERDFLPLFWRWFTLPAIEKILRFFTKAYLESPPKLEFFDDMDLWSSEGKITKCKVYFKVERYPLIQLPALVGCALIPIAKYESSDNVLNPKLGKADQ